MARQITILLVVDSRTLGLYLALLLRRMGFRSLMAETYASAEEMLAWEKVDILLLDSHPGAGSAIQSAQSLRSASPVSDLPFIVLADRDEPAERQASLEAGCRAYLLKPVQPRKLHQALQANLRFPSGERKNLRGLVNLMVEVSLRGQSPRLDQLLSLSRGGALIAHPGAIPTGTTVSLILPIGDDLLPLSGTVIYNRQDMDVQHRNAFAILFHQQTLVHADKIESYLESSLERECQRAANLQKHGDVNMLTAT